MAIVFPYIEEECEEDTTLRPKIPALLIGPRNRQTVLCLLDSGSDSLCMLVGLARFLGIDLKGERMEVIGISGEPTPGTKSTVDVEIRGQGEAHRLKDLEVDVLDTNSIEVLLGREPFFEEFDIMFFQSDKTIVVRKIAY